MKAGSFDTETAFPGSMGEKKAPLSWWERRLPRRSAEAADVRERVNYAVDPGDCRENPVTAVRRRKSKVPAEADLRVVANPEQDRSLRAAVPNVGSCKRARGRRLVGLFAAMYYGGFRPAEAVGPAKAELLLPSRGPRLGPPSGHTPCRGQAVHRLGAPRRPRTRQVPPPAGSAPGSIACAVPARRAESNQ